MTDPVRVGELSRTGAIILRAPGLANVLGTIAYSVNTMMLMFDTSQQTSFRYDYELSYVVSGGLGSVCSGGCHAGGKHCVKH